MNRERRASVEVLGPIDGAAIFRSFGFAGHPALHAIGVANLTGRVPKGTAFVDAKTHVRDGAENLVSRIHRLPPSKLCT